MAISGIRSLSDQINHVDAPIELVSSPTRIPRPILRPVDLGFTQRAFSWLRSPRGKVTVLVMGLALAAGLVYFFRRGKKATKPTSKTAQGTNKGKRSNKGKSSSGSSSSKKQDKLRTLRRRASMQGFLGAQARTPSLRELQQTPRQQLPKSSSPMVQQYQKWFAELGKNKQRNHMDRLATNMDYLQELTGRYALLVERVMERVQLPQELRKEACMRAVESFYGYTARSLCSGQDDRLAAFRVEGKAFREQLHRVTDPFFGSAEHLETLAIDFALIKKRIQGREQLKLELEKELGDSYAIVRESLENNTNKESYVVDLKSKLCRLYNHAQRLVLREHLLKVIKDEGFVGEAISDPLVLGSDIHLNQSWLTEQRMEVIVKRCQEVYHSLGDAKKIVDELRARSFQDNLPSGEKAVLSQIPEALRSLFTSSSSITSVQTERDRFRGVMNQTLVARELKLRQKGTQAGSYIQRGVLMKKAGVGEGRYNQACSLRTVAMQDFLHSLLIPKKLKAVAPTQLEREIARQSHRLLMDQLEIPKERQHEIILRIEELESLERRLRADHFPKKEKLANPLAQKLQAKFPEMQKWALGHKRGAREIGLRVLIESCINKDSYSSSINFKGYFADKNLESCLLKKFKFYQTHFSGLVAYQERIQGTSAGMDLGGDNGRCRAITSRVLAAFVVDPKVDLKTAMGSLSWAADGFNQAVYQINHLRSGSSTSDNHQNLPVKDGQRVLRAKQSSESPENCARSFLKSLEGKSGAFRFSVLDGDKGHAVGFFVDEESKRYIWHDSNSMAGEFSSREKLEACFVDYVKTFWPELKVLGVTQLLKKN